MPEDPVAKAAASFNTAIIALAKSAPSTANMQRILSYEMIAPFGLSRKKAKVAMVLSRSRVAQHEAVT
jgi:hypothetical protein